MATRSPPWPSRGRERQALPEALPVAARVLELLERRRRENGELGEDGGWVFPTRDLAGRITHVGEAKEQRYEGCRKVRRLPSPHRPRDTFATAAHEAGVHPLDLKALMNHALPAADDVTMGYIRPSVEHLRGCVERSAGFLGERMGVEDARGSS